MEYKHGSRNKAADIAACDDVHAGVWIFGGGIRRQRASVVAVDGTTSAGPLPEPEAVIGGFSIVEVPSLDDAIEWASRIAKACRCAQEVREIMFDPES